MKEAVLLEKHKLTWGLLFLGFCCVFGWIGTNFILLTQYTNSRHFASFGVILHTILGSLIYTSFYIVLGLTAFIWAARRFKRTRQKEGLIAKSLIPAVCLTPLLAIGGIAVILMAPFAYAHIQMLIMGPDIVQSQISPNQQYQAYVADLPSIDGPNHHLYVKETASGDVTFVTNLPEDVDANEEILWSPYNDIVVFKTHFKLIAYAPASDTKEEIVLGGEYHWRKNGTFRVDYKDVKKPVNIRFPEAGVFACDYEESEETSTVDLK